MAKSRRKRRSKAKGARLAKTGRGRPPGSRKINGDTVEVVPGACKRCGSTERAVLDADGHRSRILKTLRYEGMTAGGFRYNHTTWLRVRCAACGQERREVHRRFIPKAGAKKR